MARPEQKPKAPSPEEFMECMASIADSLEALVKMFHAYLKFISTHGAQKRTESIIGESLRGIIRGLSDQEEEDE